MKNREFAATLFTSLLFCPLFSQADLSIGPGDYILVKIPSKSEPLATTDIGVMPAKIFEKDNKLFLYFKNTVGPNIVTLDGKGQKQDLTGGLFEIITSASGGDLLFFRSIEAEKKEAIKPEYLGSVYRGGVWGSTYRGVFVDRHNIPSDQGLFLLIPTDLTVELPNPPNEKKGKQGRGR